MTGQNEAENEAFKKYSGLSRQIIKRGGGDAYSEISHFTMALRDKFGYDAVNQCKMYHVLVLSGASPEQVSQFDFEGDDSIVLFLDQLADKYLKEPTGE